MSHHSDLRESESVPSVHKAHYLQIEEWLTEQCFVLPPGSALPSETEVAEQFGVSRMTARRAFQRLARQGMIERRRGAGSFVRPPQLHREEALLRAFTEDMRGRGIEASSRVLRAEVARLPEQATILGLPPSTPLVVIERVRLADGIPVALEQAVLPGEFTPVLEADLERGSLHRALADLGRELGRATGQVTARIATEDEARLLLIDSPAALLVETRLISDTSGRAVESTETAYVGSRWILDTGSFVAPVSPRAGN